MHDFCHSHSHSRAWKRQENASRDIETPVHDVLDVQMLIGKKGWMIDAFRVGALCLLRLERPDHGFVLPLAAMQKLSRLANRGIGKLHRLTNVTYPYQIWGLSDQWIVRFAEECEVFRSRK